MTDQVIDLPSPCLVVLVGPAGSGKSTWARTNLGRHVVSSDSLRDLVGEGEHDLRASADAFAVLDDVVARRLARRLTTVIDSLGTDAARRDEWRRLARRNQMPCVAVLFDVGSAQLRRQNRARAKRVPDDVVRRQLAEWPAVMAAVEAEPFDAVHHLTDADLTDLTGAASTTGVALVPAALRRRAPTTTADAAAGRRGMRLGLQVPQFTWPGGPAEIGHRLRGIAVQAEAIGLDSLWVMDHFRQIRMMGPPWHDMLESWTTLAHLAACTTRMRLGTLVTGITYRNVAHLAKIVATLDVLSGGRAVCGVGLAWFEDEHRAYGWPFPTAAERYALLEDALQLLPRMWGPGAKPFDGRVLHVPDTSCYPRPLQAHLPILVGGSGERRTLRLVAQYADACNVFGDEATVARKVAVLRAHCAAVGRDPAEIAVTHLSAVLVGDDAGHIRELVDATRPPKVSAERHARAVNAGTIDQHLERLSRFAAVGVDEMIISVAGLNSPGSLDPLGRLAQAWRAQLPTVADG